MSALPLTRTTSINKRRPNKKAKPSSTGCPTRRSTILGEVGDPRTNTRSHPPTPHQVTGSATVLQHQGLWWPILGTKGLPGLFYSLHGTPFPPGADDLTDTAMAMKCTHRSWARAPRSSDNVLSKQCPKPRLRVPQPKPPEGKRLSTHALWDSPPQNTTFSGGKRSTGNSALHSFGKATWLMLLCKGAADPTRQSDC